MAIDTIDFPDLLRAAAQSPLGLLGLTVLVLAAIGLVFFKDASPKTKLTVFFSFFVGAIFFVVALFRTVNTSPAVNPLLPIPAPSTSTSSSSSQKEGEELSMAPGECGCTSFSIPDRIHLTSGTSLPDSGRCFTIGGAGAFCRKIGNGGTDLTNPVRRDCLVFDPTSCRVSAYIDCFRKSGEFAALCNEGLYPQG